MTVVNDLTRIVELAVVSILRFIYKPNPLKMIEQFNVNFAVKMIEIHAAGQRVILSITKCST